MEKKTKLNPIDLELLYHHLNDISQKAVLALSNVTGQYFNCYTPGKDDFKIQFAFPEAALYCSIAEDYITDLQDQMEELKKITYSILENK